MSTADGTVSWKALIHRLDAFVEAWESADAPPELGEFLPDEEEKFHPAWLVELIKVDLEYRWERGLPERHLEDYARKFPSLCPEGSYPLDLIYEEYHIRCQLDEDVDPNEYVSRFSSQADVLDSLLNFEAVDASTSMHKQGGRERFEAGQMIDDFDLLLPLGEGAFAQVFLARQISMQRLVAVKISAAKGEEHKTLAQLDHPYIVRVYSQTVLEDRGIRLLYMQYHAGGTLKEVVDALKPLPLEQRIGSRYLAHLDEVLEQRGATIPRDSMTRVRLAEYQWMQVVCWLGARIADALHYSHAQGVLHRDLKPANVLVGSDGSPMLADFNISFCKQIEGSSPVAYFGGSLAYMSPEQLEACDPTRDREPDELDARSDVYSLGVLLWELLQGKRPFQDLGWALQGSQLLGEMLSDREAGPDVGILNDFPPLVRRTLERCLQHDRDARFLNAAELSRQLDLCVDPEVHDALDPPTNKLFQWMVAHPLLGVLLIAAIPNGTMSILNIAYNQQEIIKLSEQKIAFGLQVGLLNAFAYGIGLSLVVVFTLPIARALKNSTGADDETLNKVRSRTLKLGYYFATISFVLWLLCGILFPLGLHLSVGRAVLNDYVHFFSSHVVNGGLAALGVFYLTVAFALERFFPRFIELDRVDRESLNSLERLDKNVQIAQGIAMTLPLASILPAAFLSENRLAFVVLAITGLIGAALAFRWTKKVRRQLRIVKKICGAESRHEVE